MPEKDKNTNEPEVKEVQTETPEKTEDNPKVEEKALGEVLETEPKKPTPKPESVPFNVFEASKNENKDLKKTIAELQTKIAEGGSKEDITSDIQAIADEFNVDPVFLRKFEKSVRASMEKEVEDKISDKFKPLEDEKNGKKREEVFSKHFDEVLGNKADLKGVVNKEVIKTLAFLPQNANKTLSQLIEETYGNASTGKFTVERTVPGGGKESGEVDFDKARSDTEYFKEVMANPELKKKYNEGLAQRALI